MTITVETITESGADEDLQIPFTRSGDTVLDSGDVGFVTSDGGANGDPRVTFAYGTNATLGSLPTSVSVSGDNFTVTHTITLAAGETRSLLQYALQNNSDTAADSDLVAFTQDAIGLNSRGALAGLSREEMLSIVNYRGFESIVDPLDLRDSEGNLWTITRDGLISSADGALTNFGLLNFRGVFNTFAGAEVNQAENSVTVTTVDPTQVNPAFVTYEYTALEDLGVIRCLSPMTTRQMETPRSSTTFPCSPRGRTGRNWWGRSTGASTTRSPAW